MSILKNNKLLAATEAKIEASLLPQTRDAYDKIVVAGMRAGLSGGPEGILAGLRQSQDPMRDCARGAVNLVVMLHKQSRGTMPAQAMIPAAMTLMIKALDFADRARIVKVGNDELAKATRIFTAYVFQTFRIPVKGLDALGGRTAQLMKDPTAMDAMARRVGVLRDPQASVPNAVIPEANFKRGA